MNRLSLARSHLDYQLLGRRQLDPLYGAHDRHPIATQSCDYLVETGDGCPKLMDEGMRNLTCQRLQVGEIWAYVQKKQRYVAPWEDQTRVGDQWRFVALDADTKLIPVHRVGKRDLVECIDSDVANAMPPLQV